MALANQAIGALKKKLGKQRLFYVCRDIERAIAALALGLPNFVIITNQSDLASEQKRKYPKNVVIHKSNRILSTQDLLRAPTAKKIIKNNDFIIVFKPTAQIEKICRENLWQLINPPAKLASEVEEKISQVKWLGELKKYLPLIKIDLAKDIKALGLPFILQFNRSHTGVGTYLISKPAQLRKIQKKFPNREARVSKIVYGPTITSNNAVLRGKVIVGNISYQITGLSPFTDKKFATVGNDWGLPEKILTHKQRREYELMVKQVGKKLFKSGWRGLFGTDAIIDDKTGRVYLIEVNARQPASTSFESILQKLTNKAGLSVFEAHLLSLFNVSVKNPKITKINSGAQIVQRITEKILKLPKAQFHKKPDWRLIQYNNTELGSDLLRMQTAKNVMSGHNLLNAHGNELSICVSLTQRNTLINLPRAGMIILRNGKILLIERRRFGYHYFVLPGGSVEKGETREKTARREIFEETGLRCKINSEKKPIIINGLRDEIYYFADGCSGKPTLGGPEKKRNNKQNYYGLKFIETKKIKTVNLLPAELKEKIIKLLS